MGQPDLFGVHIESSSDVAHVHLTGRFDAVAVPKLDDAIAEARPRHVVLDLGELTFMDGAAWLAVMSYEHRVRAWGRSLRLVNAFGAIRRIFESTETEYLLTRPVTR